MEWSNFVYYIHIGDTVRIKSSKNLNTIEMNEALYNRIDRALSAPNDDEEILKYINHLLELELLVQSQEQEKEDFLRDIHIAISELSREYTVVITPTMKCNFYCVYCYENGSDRSCDISKEVMNSLFVWIQENLIVKKQVDKIHFKLFGGEPLFASYNILADMLLRIRKLPIEFTTELITNGYLLDEKMMTLLSMFNLESVQVTLDGPAKYHDKQRMLKNGAPTFNTIVKNFKLAISKGISKYYIIRINCCLSNIDLIPELLQFISEEFSESKDKIVFSFGFVGKGFDVQYNHSIEENCLYNNNDNLKKYVDLYKLSNDLGFPTADYYALSALCSYKTNDSIIVQANGKIVKCLRGIGRDEYVESTIDKMEPIVRDSNDEEYKKCFDNNCPFIPYCHLGCQHDLYVSTLDRFKRNCKRNLIEYINKELLRIMY